MRKSAILAATAIAALTVGASAQSNNWIEIETDDQLVAPLDLTVDQLEDFDVFDADGEEVGEVEAVLGSQDGTPAALAVEVGGFLDIGDEDIIVPLDNVSIENGAVSLDMTASEMETLDRWDD